MRIASKPMPRAHPGQGRETLQAKAIALASARGHQLGRFHAAEGKSKRSATILFRGKLVTAALPQVFRAACTKCGETAIVDQHEWIRDRLGVGGRAIQVPCAADFPSKTVPMSGHQTKR